MATRILIVDDEAQVRLALRTRLARFKCDILEAEDLLSAKSVLSQHREEIRLVILDLRLVTAQEEEGQESGLHLLREELGATLACVDCGRLSFSPNVIVLTAHPSVRSCRAAFLAGAFDFLDKNDPNVWDSLIERVGAALNRPRGGPLYAARKWIEAHFEELISSHAGETIAMEGENIVAASSTLDEVREELSKKHIRPGDCLIVTVPDSDNSGAEQ
ncbi:MAG: response regulator [Kiritimatiellia bacterium]|jgi:DNA-binding NtrC family response regulator|nr:response regulator [Kiritimatiellia bacterium]MDP6847321.1 response regulator [Kiritimatiellia bacterium]